MLILQSIASSCCVLTDGSSTEISVLGNERLIGIAFFMGRGTTPKHAIVRCVRCNRHHSIDQRLCRWLLMSLDRLSSNPLTMAQELIANMLGVKREGVTAAGSAASSAPSRARSACSVSAWERAETYSPAAIDIAPATRPATPISTMLLRLALAGATPTMRLAVETMPSLAPRTAARGQPIRFVR
jgi:hypothetical protein